MSFRVIRWADHALPSRLEELLAEAEGAGFGWMGQFVPEWERRAFLETGEGLFVVMPDEAPVAMAVISRDGLVPDPDAGRLRYVFVRQEARRQGLAEALVVAALAEADRRWRRVTLHTDNPVAGRLYLRHGFTAVADTPRTTHQRLNIAVETRTAP